MTKLMTSREVADVLGVPLRTLDQWAYLGKGPAFIKVGRHRRYDAADVDQYVRSCRVEPKDAA